MKRAGRTSGGRARTRGATPSGTGPARLWAPWRMTYLARAHEPDGCLFCRVARSRSDARDLVLARRENALLMLNRFPYASGHLMVAPLRHHGSFAGLSAEERDDLFALTEAGERALALAYRPHGLNVGANLGRVAGAGFPGHLHLHLVPRWDGDTNFMPVVAGTKVLPEALGDTWRRLRTALRELAPATSGGSRGRARRAGARRRG